MKRTEPAKTGPARDGTRHEILRVNPLRNTSQIVETVVGARRADARLERYKKTLTPAQIARGDSYIVRSCSALGSTRRLSLFWSAAR